MLSSSFSATRIAAADFDYADLGPAAEIELRSRAEAIRGILGERFIVRSAPDVVRLGRLLTLVHDCLGIHRFQKWLAAEFARWKKPRISNVRRAAAFFKDVTCLDQFLPSALYVLSRHRVPAEARLEAIERAGCGEEITPSLAQSIVDQHTGLPVAIDELREACRLLARLRRGLESMNGTHIDKLAPHLDALDIKWQELQASIVKE